MIEKLTYASENDFHKPCWVDDLGDYNKMPTPFIEVTEGEFLYRISLDHKEFIDSRQVLHDGRFAALWIFWGSDNGYAIMFPDKWHVIETPDGRRPTAYTEKPRFFIIGCEHKFVEDTPEKAFRCWHSYLCVKCGLRMSVDSSD